MLLKFERLKLGLGGRFVEAGVEEALAVLGPRGVGELGPFQLVGKHFPSGNLHHVPRGPIRTGLGAGVGHVLSIIAEGQAGQGDCAVLGPLVRIEQHPRLVVQGVPHVQDRLVLQAVVLEVVVAAPFLHRRGVLGEVPEVGQAAEDGLPLGNRLEVGVGDLVFGGHPIGDLRRTANVGLEPAIGIGHFAAVIVVDLISPRRRRIVDPSVRSGGRQGREQQGKNRQNGTIRT